MPETKPGSLYNVISQASKPFEGDDSPTNYLEANTLIVDEDGNMHRGLKLRHIQMIALGGCIGTGLFVGSGSALSQFGPAPLLIAYLILSFMIWLIMNILGEMGTWLPLPGALAPHFVLRYLDASLGFATGWNYWYLYAVLVMAEVSAAAIIVEYWTDKVPVAVWITIFLVVIVVLNFLAVLFFGEAEFYFAGIKIITILGLIVVGIVLFFGGGPNHDRLGFRYWKHPGAFNEYIDSGNTGKFLACWLSIVRAGYAFVFSPELVITAAAGELESPRRNIPKGVKRFVYRLAFFYITSVIIIGCIVSSKDPKLVLAVEGGVSTAGASPFVIGIQNAGIHVLNHIINAAVLTSAWSAGNSFLYAGTRLLFLMARDGNAPRIFAKCNRWGTPYYAVAATSLFSCLAYLNSSPLGANAFTWFSNISTISGFIAWIMVGGAYIRWRKAVLHQGLWDRVPFKTPLQPYGTYFMVGFMTVLSLTNGYQVFTTGKWSASNFVAAYISIPVFFFLYVVHKVWLYFQTGYGKLLIPVEEIDVTTGLEEVEEEEAATEERVPRNVFEKFWFWLM